MIKYLTAYEAKGRIRAMRPGTRICWFRGYLPRARYATNYRNEEATKEARRVNELANFMLRAGLPPAFQYSADGEPMAGLGLGHLTQRRLALFDYEYLFTKS